LVADFSLTNGIGILLFLRAKLANSIGRSYTLHKTYFSRAAIAVAHGLDIRPAMTYYVSKIFWLLAAPTSALVLISAIGALWAVLGSSNWAAWLAAAAACGLVIGAFTPIGLALAVPLENRFPFSRPIRRSPGRHHNAPWRRR
jgi:hypothetical protein